MKLQENNKSNPRQIIVVRRDLDMTPGKLAAQVAHASLGALLKSFIIMNTCEDTKLDVWGEFTDDNPVSSWLAERFTKIVVMVNSEEELMKVYTKALEKGLKCSLITDAGFTEFEEPTVTCLGIGPHNPEDFIGVTDKLRLYK